MAHLLYKDEALECIFPREPQPAAAAQHNWEAYVSTAPVTGACLVDIGGTALAAAAASKIQEQLHL
jgi:hypothetical protein